MLESWPSSELDPPNGLWMTGKPQGFPEWLWLYRRRAQGAGPHAVLPTISTSIEMSSGSDDPGELRCWTTAWHIPERSTTTGGLPVAEFPAPDAVEVAERARLPRKDRLPPGGPPPGRILGAPRAAGTVRFTVRSGIYDIRRRSPPARRG